MACGQGFLLTAARSVRAWLTEYRAQSVDMSIPAVLYEELNESGAMCCCKALAEEPI
jgi:hypothetical protein